MMTSLTRFAAWCAGLLALSASAAPLNLTPPELSDGLQPQVAVSPDGRVQVVFGRGNAIYSTASRDDRTFTAPVKIGELDKLALRMRRGPRIAATNAATVVTAISHTDGDLHAWTSADQGATWKEGPRINESSHSAREGLHAMAGDGRSTIAVAWLDLRNGGTELWSRVSRDAGASWEPEVRIYASPDGHICQCCQPTIAIGPRGEMTAMWRNSLAGSRDLWMATSRDGGRQFEPAQKIGTGTWKLNACPMDGGALAIDPAGHPVSVWRRERALFLSLQPDAEEKLANHAAQPVAAFADGKLIVIWEEHGALKIRRGQGTPEIFATEAHAPSIAALPAGGAVVVWESTANGRAALLCDIVSP